MWLKTECGGPRPSTVSDDAALALIPDLYDGRYFRFYSAGEVVAELDSGSEDEAGSTHGGTAESSLTEKGLAPPNIRPNVEGIKSARLQSAATSTPQAETVPDAEEPEIVRVTTGSEKKGKSKGKAEAAPMPPPRGSVKAQLPDPKPSAEKGQGEGTQNFLNQDWKALQTK